MCDRRDHLRFRGTEPRGSPVRVCVCMSVYVCESVSLRCCLPGPGLGTASPTACRMACPVAQRRTTAVCKKGRRRAGRSAAHPAPVCGDPLVDTAVAVEAVVAAVAAAAAAAAAVVQLLVDSSARPIAGRSDDLGVPAPRRVGTGRRGTCTTALGAGPEKRQEKNLILRAGLRRVPAARLPTGLQLCVPCLSWLRPQPARCP